MKGNLVAREPEILARWEAGDLEGEIRRSRKGSPRFVLHDGPPYANGSVHLGTALNKVLKDFIVKSRTMMGFDSPFVPGWDCHGMPIEHRVLGEAEDGGRSLTRGEVRSRCRAYAAKYVEIQKGEFRRLGVFGRWDGPYLTMSRSYEAGIVRAFAALVRGGYVYQGLRPISWCTTCSTALADAEVEYAPHSSPSIWVAFEQCDPHRWASRGVPAGAEVVIWTTTPWTLPANMAVALNPGERYVLVASGERRMLVASRRAAAFVASACPGGTVLEAPVLQGADLEGLELLHPLFEGRKSLVVVSDHVTMEDGSGCVHTAPGHGAEDFAVGQQYGLETFSPVDAHGFFTPEAGKYSGARVTEANSAIIEDLRSRGRLVGHSLFEHSYPHCWRCKQPLIFRATRQFFMSLSHRDLKNRVLEAVEDMEWLPVWGHERMRNMMSARPDWCLSRQRAWGVALPAFTCASCGTAVLDPEVIEAVADVVEKEGSDAWFCSSPDRFFELAGKIPLCSSCGSRELARVDDILDVWFDSSLSHYCVLTPEFGLERPADAYLEATDQHRGWFGVSLLTSLALELGIPARRIVTHGLILDRQGKKMSKSLGNTVSPLEIVESMGADILRLWFSGIDYTADFRADRAMLDDAREAYRKIRNTVRFMLGNLAGLEAPSFAPGSLTGLDRYIYLRFSQAYAQCVRDYEAFQFHRVFRELRNLATTDLSGLFLDARKDRLYCDSPSSPRTLETRSLVAWMTVELVKLLAPILPFTAEEAWAELPPGLRGVPSVHLALWRPPSLSEVELEELGRWEPYLEIRRAAMKRLEEARAAGAIGSGLDAEVDLGVPEGMTDSALGESWADFLIVSTVRTRVSNEPTVSVTPSGAPKCARCWKLLPEVGADREFADVCARCAGVLRETGHAGA
ncbi:isoleucine--tRNA ligase [Candidatus Fermentibacteria bacterium]|nr:isoleucine--tRNA ligase [Candidatus Fermentibacteria bacterium]